MKLTECLKIAQVFVSMTLFCSLQVNAQNIQLLLDPVNPYQKQSLFSLTILNNSGYSGQVNLKAILKNRRGKVLMTQELTESILPNESKGVRGSKSNLKANFLDSDFAQLYNSNQQLPPLNYILCVEAMANVELNSKAQECIDYQASDFINITAVYPPDEETIYDPRPQFNWINLDPTINYNYDFKLVAVNDGQNKNVALRRNSPIIFKEDLSSNQLNYFSDATPLENLKEYAWQVTVNYQGEKVARTDGFSFNYKDSEEYIEFPRDLSYVDITEIESGANLFAVGEFKFKFPSDDKNSLSAELFELKKDKKKKIELTNNQFNVELGVNKFELDLKEQVYLKHLKKYELILKDEKKGVSYQMTVTYVNPDFIK